MAQDPRVDLSKLKIDRAEVAPANGLPRHRYWLLIYVGSTIFLGLAAFFFFKTMSGGEVIELTTVSIVSASQANALLTASGYVVAQRKASIASKATGRIVYLGFEEGDQVKRGTIIARIESDDVEAALAQAKADLSAVQAERNETEQALQRSRTLLERQLISQAENEGAEARHARVIATIASREAAVRAAEVQIENTRIRAPFDGTILSKNADVGEVVAPFAAGASSRVAVVTIADMTSLEVEADVSESNIERISSGMPCSITLDAYPDKRYPGIVDKIVPTADRAKATVLTKVRFTERDNRVLPEMSAKVNFLSSTPSEEKNSPPIIAVEASAIVTRKSKQVAFRYQDQSVTEVAVVVGPTVGVLVRITSGLAPGDKVVLHPSEKLHSGADVKLSKE